MVIGQTLHDHFLKYHSRTIAKSTPKKLIIIVSLSQTIVGDNLLQIWATSVFGFSHRFPVSNLSHDLAGGPTQRLPSRGLHSKILQQIWPSNYHLSLRILPAMSITLVKRKSSKGLITQFHYSVLRYPVCGIEKSRYRHGTTAAIICCQSAADGCPPPC